MVKGIAETEGVVSILRDFGSKAKIRLRSDASAAIGIVQRSGLGKVRHLAVGDLWIQQRVRDGGVDIEKMCGNDNPSDLMTKALDAPRMNKLMSIMGLVTPEAGQGSSEENSHLPGDSKQLTPTTQHLRSRERGGV